MGDDALTTIDTERERRLDELLLAVFERTESDRRAFLERACDGDETLLADALDHLVVEEEMGDFLQRPALLEMPVDGTVEATGPDPDNTTVALPKGSRGPVDSNPSDGLRGALRDLGKDRLGSYDIVGYAGGGGMGQVYIGEDARLRRRVAVKTLPKELAERPGWLARFEQEAQALGTLNHPNIVTIHSIEEDAGIHFLTMELVQGRTLKDALADGYMPLDDLLQVATSLTSALGAAHRQGVIHRDLKPANVMVADDGPVKILDFGIAKMSGEQQISEDGKLIGTVPYMSPEQLRGEQVDSRCDLFSLGVVLYQLATGSHPFPASSAFRRVSAILWHAPQPIGEVRPDLPVELVEAIGRCLEKDPADRYQRAEEIEDDLQQLSERLLAERVMGSRTDLRAERRPAPPLKWGALVIVLVLLAALWWRQPSTPPPSESPTAPLTAVEDDRTSVVVLPFSNLTEDPELRWLSNGFAELLVTDLAQSADLSVLGSSRVYGILKGLDALDASTLDPEVRRQVAALAGAAMVVRGSFVRLGETLRMDYALEGAEEERVLLGMSLDGNGPEDIFRMADDISNAVLEHLGAGRPEIGPQTIEEATTRSVAAWKAYSEAYALQRQSKTEEAIDKWQEAIELDPQFAIAYAQISRVLGDLGRNGEAREAAAKAFQLADRLPLLDRFDVEASFYENQWATNGRAIETYRIGLGIYPQMRNWRNNLARRYAFFEKYDQALEVLNALIDEGTSYSGTYTNAANAYAALGEHARGDDILKAYDAPQDDWLIRFARGYHLTEWGQLEGAEQALDQAATISPNNAYVAYGRWRIHVLRRDWQRAQDATAEMLDHESGFAGWRGYLSKARNALFQGRSGEALQALKQAAAVAEDGDRGRAYCDLAEIYLAGGDYLEALEASRQAQEHGAKQWPELEGFFLTLQSQAAFGRMREAQATLEMLSERWRQQPNAVEERQVLMAQAILAQQRGDTADALAQLDKAQRLLPPRGVEFSWHLRPDHVALWLRLGELELSSGRPEVALQWLERVTASGVEHIERPLDYVRGFYLAGIAADELGQVEESRAYLSTFLEMWGDGDLYPAWIEEATRRLSANQDSASQVSSGQGVDAS